MSKKNLKKNWMQYSNLGFQIIATLGLFGWIGSSLDQRYPDASPYCFIGLLFIGVAIALYHLWNSIS